MFISLASIGAACDRPDLRHASAPAAAAAYLLQP